MTPRKPTIVVALLLAVGAPCAALAETNYSRVAAAIDLQASNARPEQDARRLHPAAKCAEAPIYISAGLVAERRLACLAAMEAIELLGRCGISPRRPLHVEITSEVRHPFAGPILGLFDIRQDKALVTQEANIPALVTDTPFAKLPPRDFYRSLIVHEVVHAVMHQNLKRPALSHAAYEYPAYALQIASLAPNVQEQFLQSFPQDAIRADAIFNDAILMFDPFYFAARAYRHFKAADNGCTHLNALLDGEVPFILTMPQR